MTTLYPVILCGGSGTRLWPLSREQYPKQLLSLVDKDTLLQSTVNRLQGLEVSLENVTVAEPVIVTNESHRFLVAEQLREIGVKNPSIILEPCAKNTAPALNLAALHVTDHDSNALMLVMPADHVIADPNAFKEAIKLGLDAASDKGLVTFGIVPDHAETGYGYIKKTTKMGLISEIEEFVEKPDTNTAQAYLESGDYVWNSGMFLFTANTWLNAIKYFKPDIANAVETAYLTKSEDMDFVRINADVFEKSPSDSIDYAVMEHVTSKASSDFRGYVVSLDAGWSDIGSWDSLWEISEKNDVGNVIKGDVFLEDTHNSMIIAEDRMVSVIGLSDIVVVETSDAIMITEKNTSQSVKKIVKQLADKNRDEIISHRKVMRPWGNYESIDHGERFQVKRIVVNPGARLSLQMHHHRAEHWIVVTGTAKVTRDEEVMLLSENESTYIPLGVKHRLENPGSIPLEIIEVQSGSYLGEDDIVRYQDEYGRNK